MSYRSIFRLGQRLTEFASGTTLLAIAMVLTACHETTAPAYPPHTLAKLPCETPSAVLYGPEASRVGQTQAYRLCLDADAAGVAQLGDGELSVVFTGASVPKDGPVAWIFPPMALQSAQERAGRALTAIAVDVLGDQPPSIHQGLEEHCSARAGIA